MLVFYDRRGTSCLCRARAMGYRIQLDFPPPQHIKSAAAMSPAASALSEAHPPHTHSNLRDPLWSNRTLPARPVYSHRPQMIHSIRAADPHDWILCRDARQGHHVRRRRSCPIAQINCLQEQTLGSEPAPRFLSGIPRSPPSTRHAIRRTAAGQEYRANPLPTIRRFGILWPFPARVRCRR